MPPKHYMLEQPVTTTNATRTMEDRITKASLIRLELGLIETMIERLENRMENCTAKEAVWKYSDEIRVLKLDLKLLKLELKEIEKGR